MVDILKALALIWIGYRAIRRRPDGRGYFPFTRRIQHPRLLTLSGCFAVLVGAWVLLNRL